MQLGGWVANRFQSRPARGTAGNWKRDELKHEGHEGKERMIRKVNAFRSDGTTGEVVRILADFLLLLRALRALRVHTFRLSHSPAF